MSRLPGQGDARNRYLSGFHCGGRRGGRYRCSAAELSDWVGMPLSEGLVLMRNALVGAGVKDKVRLAASGKIYSGMGLARNLAQGRTGVMLREPLCRPSVASRHSAVIWVIVRPGVTSQQPGRQRGLIPEVQGERAARFHAKTLEALADIVAAAGFKHPTDLQPHHLMHRTGPEKAVPMDRIQTFLPEGILLEAPQDTLYADWWQAARADSFRPALDVTRLRSIA
ncbi:MAG: glutamate synthase-related protein [Thiolinea sp.]